MEDIDSVIDEIEQLQSNQITLIDKNISTENVWNANKAMTLASQINSDWPLINLVTGIYIAENLVDAKQMRKSLTSYESVITKDGIWLGSNWVRISKGVSSNGENY